MEIVYYNSDTVIDNLSVTIGAFDCIHDGHIKILNKLKMFNKPKAVLTFKVHPDYTLHKRLNYGNLFTLEEKIKVFTKYNIDYMIVFDEDVLKLSYLQFNKLLINLGVKNVVVGSDFKYGLDSLGSFETLLKDFHVDVINCDETKISSDLMRKLIESGKVDQLRKNGLPYFEIYEKVEIGKGLANKLGFPTANLLLHSKYSNILKGVYVVSVEIDNNKYLGICNVGINPTTDNLLKPRVEVHIIDFNDDIYGKYLKIKFLKFLREEIHFENVEMLKKQVLSDIETVRKEYKNENCIN